MNVFNYNFAALTGGALALERFRSQPILLVNTASKCGFTSHYAQLQQLHNDYQQSGLVVIGMPCNDFGEQEPDSEEEIAEFVRTEYNVTFPMTAKYSVIGINAHPLFKDLAQEHGGAVLPRWNFHKYLFNRKGALVEHWPAQTPPDDPAVTHQIARNLQSWSL
ncbi:MAG: glutathione peroxidase [Wenzhouxiangella sp.]|nr:glutathione peroxidase [Wenzhouxiangella sp.]